jgi:hypothetical protein
LVGANGSWSADSAFAHAPGFDPGITTRKSGLSSTPRPPGSIDAIRKGSFTTFAGKNVILSHGIPHWRAAVIRVSRLTFADDNGLLPGSAKSRHPRKK